MIDKHELIDKIEKLNKVYGDRFYIERDEVLALVKQLNEPEKVKIPQFVADWLSNLKSGLFGLNYDSVPSEIYDWVYATEDNLRKLHLAFVYGYEVGEEKRYQVKAKGLFPEKEYLILKFGHVWIFCTKEENEGFRTHHTRSQLEEAGFGWVFGCERIVVEEVEDDSEI